MNTWIKKKWWDKKIKYKKNIYIHKHIFESREKIINYFFLRLNYVKINNNRKNNEKAITVIYAIKFGRTKSMIIEEYYTQLFKIRIFSCFEINN